MAETEFAIAYEGPALEDGRMPVRDLAPALLALGDLFSEAANTLYPERPPVSLEIQATNEGSFLVDLILSGAEWDQLVDLFDSDTVNALINLKELIIVGAAGGGGLLWLIKQLQGRRVVDERPVREPSGVEGDQVRLTLEDGTTLEVPTEVATLQRSLKVRRAVRNVMQPLSKDGVDKVRVVSTSETEVVVEKTDLPAYELPESEPEPIGEQEFELVLEIVSVVFAEGNKWRLGDGVETFYVTVKDQAFLDRIDRGEAFRKGDRLRCRVRWVQTQRGDQLHTEREVVQVIAHIPAGEQLVLRPPIEGESAA